MSKKIDLTKVGNVTYAVLCPEKGYLKWLDGQAVFTDALPVVVSTHMSLLTLRVREP
jgi:hypothetical protein